MSRYLRGRQAKKGSKKAKSNNQSSQATSETHAFSDMGLDTTQDEPQVKIEVFGDVAKLVYPCFLLITPNAMISFEQAMLPKLVNLAQKYQIESARKFILDNLKAHQIYNIDNALKIEDNQFWNGTLHSLIKLLVQELPSLPWKFKILQPYKIQTLVYTRLDVLILLSCMLLGIMPKQLNEQSVHFGQLMTIRDIDLQDRIPKRRQKLKCLFAYFNIMMKNKELFKETVRIQRTFDKNKDLFNPLKLNSKFPLKKVTVLYNKESSSEQFCGKAIITNHASQCVGINALKNGMNRQDILFALFSELILIKLLCPQTGDHEAIIFYGARRFAKYNGQFKNFLYEGEHPLQKAKTVQKTVIVSIDPANYNKYGPKQFTKMGVIRELTKAYVGFNGASLIQEKIAVCTGKWGCGAIGGDQVLKFLIQWIATSKANRDMMYMVNSSQKVTIFKLFYQELSHLDGTELLSLLYEYCQKSQLRSFKTTLQDFLKFYT